MRLYLVSWHLGGHSWSTEEIESYCDTCGVEVIDVIRAWNLGFCLGNAIKYIARAGYKDPKTRSQDLQKAINYLYFEIHGEWPKTDE